MRSGRGRKPAGADQERRQARGREKRSAGTPGDASFRQGVVALALLALVALLIPLFSASWGVLYNETDGQYAAAARTMAEGGSWLIPENNGTPRLVKPPLLVWMVALSFSAFGVHEWSARLPGAVGLAMWVLATAMMGWRILGHWRGGCMAGFVLLTSLGVATLGRIIMPEPWFCAFLTFSLWAGWAALDGDKNAGKFALLFWTAAGLASFVKGWHGFVLPLLIVGVAAIPAGRLRNLPALLLSWPGWIIALGLNLPWLLYVEAQFPGFLRHFFWQEGVGHVAGWDSPETTYDNVSRGKFLLLHLAWLFPWILIWPFGLLTRRHWAVVRGDGWLIMTWGLLGLAILMLIGQRQDYYGMMLWPAFALAVARMWDGGMPDASKLVASLVLVGIGAVALAAALVFPVWKDWLPAETSALAERATAWQTLSSFDGGVWQSLLFYLAVAGGGMLVGGLGGFWFGRRGNLGISFVFWGVAAFTLGLCGTAGMARVAPWFSQAELARWLQQNDPHAAHVCFDGAADTGSSLIFYLGRPIYLVQASPEIGFVAREFGPGREYFWSPDDLAAAWQGPNRVYLVTEQSLLHHWQILLPGARPFARSGTQVLLGR